MRELLTECRVALVIEDTRTDGSSLDVDFQGELLPFQTRAVRSLSNAETGVLVAPPGSGKVEQRASTLRTSKLKFYIAQLAREADRFEYVLTGKDVH